METLGTASDGLKTVIVIFEQNWKVKRASGVSMRVGPCPPATEEAYQRYSNRVQVTVATSYFVFSFLLNAINCASYFTGAGSLAFSGRLPSYLPPKSRRVLFGGDPS